MTLFFVHHQHTAENCPAADPEMGAMLLNHLSRPNVRSYGVEAGDLTVRGVAWSGAPPIARVEVSVAGGPWQEARLIGERTRHSWQWWELLTRVDRSGPLALRARATDLAGRTQPDEPDWNRLGYGNNAIQEVDIAVS